MTRPDTAATREADRLRRAAADSAAWSLFAVALDYWRGKVRVECESPRTDENFLRVDAAINAAVNAHEEARQLARDARVQA